MIKEILFVNLILFSFLNMVGHAQSKNEKFILTGKIIGQADGYVSLSYISREGKQVRDSCLLQHGNFFFKGKIIEPTLASLKGDVKSIADDNSNATSFYLEPGNMTATAEKNHLKEIKITGSKTQKEYEMLQKKYEAVDNESDLAYEKFSKINYRFIITHPDSYVSSFQLALYKTRWPLDSVRLIYNQLSPAIQKSFYGKEVAKTINEVDNNSPGKMAKPFTTIDINGDSTSLLNFKGKYVLLDFWASWCLPCRQNTPHLIELFKKYHNRGLDIIGVSDDDNVGAWKSAVEKDKVGIWYNILSGFKINNTGEIDESKWISKKFGVHVLPTKILINKSGIIIGRYTGTEEEPALDEKLGKIFE